MKNYLIKLSHEEILRNIKKLVSEERKVSVSILRYLAEVNRRKFFLEMGYGSLFDFTMRELGYSSGAAYRRIEAMKMLTALPSGEAQAIENKMIEGKVNLSNLAMVHNSVKEQTRNGHEINLPTKMNWVEQTIGLTTRDAEKKLKNLVFEATGVLKKYSKTVVLEITEDQLQKIDEIRSRSHRFSSLKDEEFFDAMLDVLHMKICRERLRSSNESKKHESKAVDKKREVENREEKKREAENREEKKREEKKREEKKREEKNIHAKKSVQFHFGAEVNERSRYITQDLRVRVLKKSELRCEYIDFRSNRRCENKKFLQIDHVMPFSKGGRSIESNLQVLCSNHNRQKGDEIH